MREIFTRALITIGCSALPAFLAYELTLSLIPVHHDLSDIASGALGLSVAVVVGLVGLFCAAIWLGRRERKLSQMSKPEN